ncbi:hypothetical protein [Sphingomonas yunnanensis]|nr:hypothetical protein [Sphingomonas yunnanensis]
MGILLDTRKLDDPLTATVTVRDEASTSAGVVHVTVVVSHTVEGG